MNHIFNDKQPSIAANTYITDGVHIIGDVTIESKCSIWYGAVLRGDDNYIKIGEGSNIQDNCVIHVSKDNHPTIIGKYVTVGHSAIIHGAIIEDNCLIGMGAIVMDGCKIGKNTIVAAGTLLAGGKEIPEGVLCMGSPGKIIRKLNQEEIAKLKESAEHYINIWSTK